jgi:hypothetical protein
VQEIPIGLGKGTQLRFNADTSYQIRSGTWRRRSQFGQRQAFLLTLRQKF